MDLDRLRQERPDIFLASDERELVVGFDEPPEEVRAEFLDAVPKLLQIYKKKRKAIATQDERLWKEVLQDEAELIGTGNG